MRVRLIVMTCLALLATGLGVHAQPASPGQLSGLVVTESGDVRNGVLVRIQATSVVGEPQQLPPPAFAIAGPDGRYQFTNLRLGEYRAEIVGDGYRPYGSAVTISAAQPVVTRHLISSPRWRWTTALVGGSILLFAVGILAFRHHNIVHTTRELLVAQLENIETRLPLETAEASTTDTSGSAADLADRARKSQALQVLKTRVGDIKRSIPRHIGWIEWFFWSRGHEISGWVRLHEVERQLVAFLVPESRVLERAVIAEAQLRGVNKPAAQVLADRVRFTVAEIVNSPPTTSGHISEHQVDHLKQQLGEALTLLYDESDTRFAGLMEWHNKAMWLVYLSLLSIIILGVVFHHEELFIIGAVGGLMSRMARTLFREDVPSDYGASWTTLFLSPLLGAISAWVGIALLGWLRDMDALGTQFDKVNWDHPVTVWTIALGFTLGFSERLFTSLLSKVEGRVTQELERPVSTPAPPTPLMLPPRGPSTQTEGPEAKPEERPASPADRTLEELDIQRGERVAFVGDATHPLRLVLTERAGGDAVVDATAESLGTVGALDAVLFTTPPTAAVLTTAAAQIASVLRQDGRVVVLGRSPAALFDADSATQRAQGHMGPALTNEILVAAGLSVQEPPDVLEGTDPVDWLVAAIRPSSGGDR